mmetsp:Transcript_25705/g.29362  ORF Transcript_25705/g.29362 Transcript_25705/m.29362 type:complete len:81 (-) Transcript_25705:1611-1853(-)
MHTSCCHALGMTSATGKFLNLTKYCTAFRVNKYGKFLLVLVLVWLQPLYERVVSYTHYGTGLHICVVEFINGDELHIKYT